MFETNAPEQDGLTPQTLMWVSLQKKGRGDPSTSKLNSNNRTFKTSLAKPICLLFTNEKLLKSYRFLHQLKFAKRSKNYTAVYKEYHQTEALIQGQLEQELKQQS